MGLPLRLQLRPSRRLARLSFAMHAAASGGVFIAAMPLLLKAILGALILLSFLFQQRRFRSSRCLQWLRLGKKGEVACGLVDGSSPGIVLLPGTVWPGVVVLRYQLDDESGAWCLPRARVILKDSLDSPESFRRLRVWLEWRARFSGGVLS